MSYDRSYITGKASILTVFLGVGILLIGLLVELPHSDKVARANVATTSVTVLNTPPTWIVKAQEAIGSSTSTPTNSGSAITWNASANDSSGDNYYLLICKNYASPTPVNNGAPTCNGGNSNLWAVSGQTASNATATVSTTTTEGFAESINLYGYICDHNSSSACNVLTWPGNGTTSSPFVVNHRPTFTVFTDDSPRDPGGTVTWYSTSSDSDVFGGADQVMLFVCKLADFTGTACGAGGTWASSTFSAADPSVTYTLPNPMQDQATSSFGYVVDRHGGHAALGAPQGTDSRFYINNMTPTIAAASISLLNTDGSTNPLSLTNPAGQTTGFITRFTVTDQNGCVNASTTNEIASSYPNVYRSGITSAGCNQSSEYNENNCYPGLVSTSVWNYTCTASSTTCLGTSDSDQVIDCTFPLWYVAQSTDGTGLAQDPPNWAQNWITSALSIDDNGASTTLVDGLTGRELNSFLAYNVSTTSISYGALQPGQSVDPISKVTDLQAVGNVGLDQTLYGSDMCPTYPTCSGLNTSTILIAGGYQKYATSSLSIGSANTLLANPGATQAIHVLKSTSSTTPASKDTYWGITVPGTITLSGDYIGVNTLIGITAPSASW